MKKLLIIMLVLITSSLYAQRPGRAIIYKDITNSFWSDIKDTMTARAGSGFNDSLAVAQSVSAIWTFTATPVFDNIVVDSMDVDTADITMIMSPTISDSIKVGTSGTWLWKMIKSGTDLLIITASDTFIVDSVIAK